MLRRLALARVFARAGPSEALTRGFTKKSFVKAKSQKKQENQLFLHGTMMKTQASSACVLDRSENFDSDLRPLHHAWRWR
jgi:hypothetical protein